MASPEACAAILWKSSQAAPKAAEKLKMTAQEHYRVRIADGIIPIMLDPQGVSKGSGFVAFSTSVEATRALNAMNGKMIGQKPLYVAVAQHKDERRAQLQVKFKWNQPAGIE